MDLLLVIGPTCSRNIQELVTCWLEDLHRNRASRQAMSEDPRHKDRGQCNTSEGTRGRDDEGLQE